jgi:cytochrome oxidase Cu insertion factor (SCO1/SenC/PrrC family)
MHAGLPLVLALAQAASAPTPAPNIQARGPQEGEVLPAFALKDQDGRERDFASLQGPNGLVLVFFRSADW